MRSHYLLLTLLVLITACSKSPEAPTPYPVVQPAFFASNEEALAYVRHYLASRGDRQVAQAIEQISYYHSGATSMAFVFYWSNSGPKNLVVKRRYDAEGAVVDEDSSSCTGQECDCKVKLVIDNEGKVTLGCNCTSCVMITSGS